MVRAAPLHRRIKESGALRSAARWAAVSPVHVSHDLTHLGVHRRAARRAANAVDDRDRGEGPDRAPGASRNGVAEELLPVGGVHRPRAAGQRGVADERQGVGVPDLGSAARRQPLSHGRAYAVLGLGGRFGPGDSSDVVEGVRGVRGVCRERVQPVPARASVKRRGGASPRPRRANSDAQVRPTLLHRGGVEGGGGEEGSPGRLCRPGRGQS